MSPTSEPRKPPRLRARAKAGTSSALRPEVADALNGLERSIGEVTDWEHLLSGAGEAGAAAPPAVDGPGASAPDVVLVARVMPQGGDTATATVTDEAPEAATEAVEVPPLAPATRRRGRMPLVATPPPPPPPSVPPPLDVNELGIGASGDALPADLALDGLTAAERAAGDLREPNLDLSGFAPGVGADPMATWVETTSSPHRFGPDPEEVRRRRNGRILSWAGAVLLIAAVAYLLIPDHSPERPSLVNDRTTSTTEEETTTTAQLGSQFSVPTLPPTTAPVIIPTTPTTAKAAKRSTPTTRAPVTTVPTTVPPPTTTQPPPTTTTTRPPPTTTTCPIGDVPEPGGGC
jgi:hypothetical protein